MVKLIPLGKITVAVAGTRVQFTATQIPTTQIVVQADSGNAGAVYIGDVTVASGIRISLAADKVARIGAEDIRGVAEQFVLSDFYVDAATNGDSIHVFYMGRR